MSPLPDEAGNKSEGRQQDCGRYASGYSSDSVMGWNRGGMVVQPKDSYVKHRRTKGETGTEDDAADQSEDHIPLTSAANIIRPKDRSIGNSEVTRVKELWFLGR